MSDAIKHDHTTGHEGYERQDLQPSGVLIFLLVLGLVTLACMFGLRFFYTYLDRRERIEQPPVSPLVTNVPADTRHIAPGYPQSVFPSPKLEEDERGQLNGIRLNEENMLNSYGWVDEKAGTVRIPIERAMDLLVQRGLPVHAQNEAPRAVGKAGVSRNGKATTSAVP